MLQLFFPDTKFRRELARIRLMFLFIYERKSECVIYYTVGEPDFRYLGVTGGGGGGGGGRGWWNEVCFV